MLRVGLTGGLACGKTFVGEELARLGCRLIQADELGHAVLEPEGEAYDGVLREFGSGILDENGRIDRRRLAADVFGRPDRLAALNALVHPPVIAREEREAAQAAAADSRAIVVVEAAILIETGSYRRFDRIILVVCHEERQIARALKRGFSPEEAQARIARQMPLEQKRKYADYVIDTSGEKSETLLQTQRIYEELRRIEK